MADQEPTPAAESGDKETPKEPKTTKSSGKESTKTAKNKDSSSKNNNKESKTKTSTKTTGVKKKSEKSEKTTKTKSSKSSKDKADKAAADSTDSPKEPVSNEELNSSAGGVPQGSKAVDAAADVGAAAEGMVIDEPPPTITSEAAASEIEPNDAPMDATEMMPPAEAVGEVEKTQPLPPDIVMESVEGEVQSVNGDAADMEGGTSAPVDLPEIQPTESSGEVPVISANPPEGSETSVRFVTEQEAHGSKDDKAKEPVNMVHLKTAGVRNLVKCQEGLMGHLEQLHKDLDKLDAEIREMKKYDTRPRVHITTTYKAEDSDDEYVPPPSSTYTSRFSGLGDFGKSNIRARSISRSRESSPPYEPAAKYRTTSTPLTHPTLSDVAKLSAYRSSSPASSGHSASGYTAPYSSTYSHTPYSAQYSHDRETSPESVRSYASYTPSVSSSRYRASVDREYEVEDDTASEPSTYVYRTRFRKPSPERVDVDDDSNKFSNYSSKYTSNYKPRYDYLRDTSYSRASPIRTTRRPSPVRYTRQVSPVRYSRYESPLTKSYYDYKIEPEDRYSSYLSKYGRTSNYNIGGVSERLSRYDTKDYTPSYKLSSSYDRDTSIGTSTEPVAPPSEDGFLKLLSNYASHLHDKTEQLKREEDLDLKPRSSGPKEGSYVSQYIPLSQRYERMRSKSPVPRRPVVVETDA